MDPSITGGGGVQIYHLGVLWTWVLTIRYDTIEKINVDSKAEYTA